MKDNKKVKPRFNIINFNEAYEPPVNKYNISKGYVEWGDKNLYPNYLLDLFNYKGSTTHKSIINKKNDLMTGRGFEDIMDNNLLSFIKRVGLQRQVKRAGLDYELFNGFAFEVIWSNDGENIASIKHIPIHKLRKGIESEDVPYPHYLFSKDWEQYRKEDYRPVPLKSYDPHNKEGKQIYVFNDYNPGMDVYPIVNYSTSINYIELDYEISVFHLNQAKQGYSPSFILNFATGIPTDEEMEEFEKDFEYKYSGTENSGKILITYSEGAEQAPTLTAVQLNDSDRRFIMLMNQIETQITRGSGIPAQLVLLVEGKLGSTEQRSELLREFQMSYVTPRQEDIEEVLNNILSDGGFNEKVKLKQYDNISAENKEEK